MRLVAIGFAYSGPERAAAVTDAPKAGYRSTPATGCGGAGNQKFEWSDLGGAT